MNTVADVGHGEAHVTSTCHRLFAAQLEALESYLFLLYGCEDLP